MRKQERQILGPALDHVTQATIHPRAQRVGRVAETYRPLRPLHIPREIDIFENRTADRAVAANREVRPAFDEQKLSVGSGCALGRIVDLSGWIDACKLGEDQRHECALGDSGNYLAWRVRQQDSLIFLSLVQR